MKAIVIGAGVAGLACALMLRKSGMDVSVFEKRAAPDILGAGVVCWPNASFVLDQLGLLGDLMLLGARPRALRRLSEKGFLLDVWDIEKLDAHMGYPSIAVFRRDLMRVILGAAQRVGIEIRFGCGAMSIEDCAGTQTFVRLADGSQIAADVIVGAEGRTDSVARRYVVGNANAVFQGVVNWIGTFESSRTLFDDRSILDFWGAGTRFGIVPVSPARAYWAGASVMSLLDGPTAIDVAAEVRGIFEGWPSPIPRILHAIQSGMVRKIALFDHEPQSRWYRNNVLLVGDAAHASLPTSGQGVAQALEDAWWLNESLETNGGDLRRVFEAFTRARYAKTTRITQAARALARDIFFERTLSSRSSGAGDFNEGLARFWGDGLPMSCGRI